MNSINTCLDACIKLSTNMPPGMLVCMGKSIFTLPDNDNNYKWNESGVTVLGIPGKIELSKKFGVLIKSPNSKYFLKIFIVKY